MERTAFNLFGAKTIAFTGGGTGGHVYPNLALIPQFAARGFDPIYIGGEGDSIERRAATAAGVRYFATPSAKLVRSLSPSALKNNLRIPFALSRAVKAATDILRQTKPDVVFSKGGFVSLPTAIAAAKLSIPLFAHESDLTLGLANKIAARMGATVLKANPNAAFDGIFVGMPLRKELFGISPAAARKRLSIYSPDLPVLLVLGGSSGAKYLNDAILDNLDALSKRYFVLHVTGRDKRAPAAFKNYMSVEYADNIGDFYAASDVVLSRAGATAVFELSALEKRAVFVPLPKGISRGDQIFNARLATEYGALSINQNERFFEQLLTSLEKSLQNAPMRAIAADANGKIADVVCDRLIRGEKCKDKKR